MGAIIIFWLLCGIVAAVIGSRKGKPITALFIGVLLGPFGILAALLSKGDRKICPFCSEPIHREATVCPRCHHDLTATGAA